MGAVRMSKKRARTKAVITALAARFPECFAVPDTRRRPLKVGIDADILAALSGTIRRTELIRALGMYCSSDGYLEHVLTGARRVDLEGKPAGVVTADDERHAKAKRADIKAKRDTSTPAESTIGQEQAKLGKAKDGDTGARQPKGLRKDPAKTSLTEQGVERRPRGRIALGAAKVRLSGDTPSRKDLQLGDAVIPQAANRANGPALAPKVEPAPGSKRLSLADLREAARRRRDSAQ
jgi:sRNA-binding protein